MKDILARDNRAVLSRHLHGGALVAFDYDGTLAPIVATPASARMRASTLELARRLAKRLPCIVVSGRAQADALRRTRGIGFREVIGNHGLEPWKYADAYLTSVQAWRQSLEAALADVSGIYIEDKAFSLAIHYRACANKRRAVASIRDAAATLAQARIVGGREVVNLVPAGAPNKGQALEQALLRNGCASAVYVGDDETDEDVFALEPRDRYLCIRVGTSQRSRAEYCIASQQKIDALLELMLTLHACEQPADVAR